MPAPPNADKRALREAAEKIEKAIDAYGAGDLTGSARELEEALKLMPQHARAQLYLGWVRDLAQGKRKLDALDEETLDAISQSLSPDDSGPRNVGDDEQTREKRPSDPRSPLELDAEPESPWDPVPLTPGNQEMKNALESPTARQQQPIAPRATAAWPPAPPPPELAPPAASGEAGRRSSSSTLLGVSPPREPSLLSAKGFYESTENTGSVTREWRSTQATTNPNLPPLDVPELTDEQIQELLALDAAIGIDGEPPVSLNIDNEPHLSVPSPGSAPQLGPLTDLGLGPTAEPSLMMEMVAEPTPEPHQNPLTQAATLVKVPPSGAVAPKRRDATSPDAVMGRMPDFPSAFDTMEQTPTRERRDLLRAVMQASPTAHDEDLQLSPLESSRKEELPEEGTNPTNPFVKRKLAEYTYGTGQLPRVDDLPPAPSMNDTSPQPVVDGLTAIQDPLDRGDVETALKAAERLVSEAGGVDKDGVKPHQWLLERVYEASIGPLGAVPTHGQPASDLDPRSAFLLSRFDGMSTVEDLLEVSGMPRLEALRCLALLIRRGAVTLK